MSPAPRVSSTSPSPSREPSASAASSAVGQPPDRAAAAAVGRRLGDHQAADPGELADRLLAGRVDVEHRDLVGGRQRGAELVREGLGARVEVGLEGGDQPALGELARRLERRRDLGRVVGVVVVDPRPVGSALELEAPGDAGEVGERRRRGAGVEPGELERGDRGERVEGVVAAGDGAARVGLLGLAVSEGSSTPGPRTPCSASTERAGSKDAKARLSSAREDQREWWSSSMLVTTAISGRSSRKLASLSSASATTHSPSPQPALVGSPSGPAPGSSPPMKKAGSAPSARSAQTSIAVVVVLPWVPATAIRRFSAQSSASSSPRWMTRWPRSRAHRQLGVVVGDRGRDHDLGVGGDVGRRRGRSAARARRRAGAPCKRTRRGRCR